MCRDHYLYNAFFDPDTYANPLMAFAKALKPYARPYSKHVTKLANHKRQPDGVFVRIARRSWIYHCIREIAIHNR